MNGAGILRGVFNMRRFLPALLVVILGLGYFAGVDQVGNGALIRNTLLTLVAAFVAFEALKTVAKAQSLETAQKMSEKHVASLEHALKHSEDRTRREHEEFLKLKDEIVKLKSELHTKTSQSFPHGGAVSLLSLLQEKGRFLDFIMDDVTPYSDAQVGAAARIVHKGCKGVIEDYFELTRSTNEGEGLPLTLNEHFDHHRFRLIGQVPDAAPYHGKLIHRGWVAAKIKLPVNQGEQKGPFVISPAEVEIGALHS